MIFRPVKPGVALRSADDETARWVDVILHSTMSSSCGIDGSIISDMIGLFHLGRRYRLGMLRR